MFPLLIALAWSDPGDTGFTSETVAVPVQGSLTDGDGLPVHGTREVTINLYDAGDTLRASQAASITFARGAFAAALDVDTEILWSVGLKLTIALDDMESDPVAVGVAPLAGVSADARRLGGWPASAFRRNHQRIAWGDVDIDDEDLRSRIYDLDDVLASECASGDTLLLGEGGQWTCVAPPDPVAAIEQATNLLFASGATLSAPGGAISTGDGEFSGTVALGGASASCGPADAGKLRWNGGAFQGCNGSAWLHIAGSVDGSSASLAAASCNAIHVAYPSLPSGNYWITPGSGAAFQVPCDMSSDGGGWTLTLKTHQDGAHQLQYSSALWTNAGTLNAGDLSISSGTAKYDSFNRLSFTDVRIVTRQVAGSDRAAVIRKNSGSFASLQSMFSSVGSNYRFDNNFSVVAGSLGSVFTACGYSDHDICAVNADITFGGNRTQVRFGDAHSWGCRGDFGFGGYHSLNAVGDGYSDWGNAYATCSGHVGPAESIGLIWVR